MLSIESPVLLIVGTRPEGIKMAPVYHALKRAGIPTILCSTMQHDHLLEEVFELFGIIPDVNLHIMRPKQDLFYLTQSVLQKTKEIFLKYKPCLVLVQGDTTSSMTAALAAFYLNIPVGHIEAGLRTDDYRSPFPEEMNRRLITLFATYHFAPTPGATANILAQGIKHERVFCTGNTVVDSLEIVKEKIVSHELQIRPDIRQHIAYAQAHDLRLAVVTIHRRESFEGGIDSLLQTIKEYALANKDLLWIYPYHPNPTVLNAINRVGLSDVPTMYLLEPVGYKDMVYLLDHADLVLTDSGGIQEEAVSLGKPVLVLREKTERMEGVLAGCAQVVGFNKQAIIKGIQWALDEFHSMAVHVDNIYGDGHAAEKIVAYIQTQYEALHSKPTGAIKTDDADMMIIQNEESIMKTVCVIGLGYIGLPTSIVLAEHGFRVIGYDIDEKKVEEINKGNPVIYEPELYEKLQVICNSDLFCASAHIKTADYFIIAVPTPITDDKKADLSYVFNATDAIARVLKKGDTVIVESTISVGTTDAIARQLEEKTGLIAEQDFYVAHCPERVLPGNIFKELISNDRIIGGVGPESARKGQELYATFVEGELYLTDAKSAEMVKLVENSSRDVELAFAHQVASMAYAQGLNPYEIIHLANKHPRVKILKPTIGVGGHCLAIDPWFLVETFPGQSSLLKTAREVNDAKPYEVLGGINRAITQWLQKNGGTCTVLLLGATYKPDIDDLRESPAMTIIDECLKNYQNNAVRFLICEPHIPSEKATKLFGERHVSITQGITQASIIAVLVGHKRFKMIDRKLLSEKMVLDFCGAFYEPTKQHDQLSFSPACSMMDFFVVNQSKSTMSEEHE